MARQLYQLADVQAAFAARIKEKVQTRRDAAQGRAEEVPLLGWLLAPLTGVAFDLRERRNVRRGERGEETVLGTLLRKLPDTWSVFHSVVVEPRPDDFAQIDLLLIGPAGMFLIEAKAWRGSYKTYRDVWHQREGNTWAAVSSPTEQVQRQARKLGQWLGQHRHMIIPQPLTTWLRPAVIFTQAQWLRASACSVEVFDGIRPLTTFLNTQPADVLTPPQVDQLCDLIVRTPMPVAVAPPIPVQNVATFVPSCPRCNVPMVLRTARQGANAGQQFYGCPNFPRCREIVASKQVR
jgi:hypothetical protein